MRLSFLDTLYAAPGPLAGVYLDTSRDVRDPDEAVGQRWRHLRDELVRQGADGETVSTLAGAVGTDGDLPGRHGQALFAARGRLLLAEELPEPPGRDTARFGEVPDAMPLAVQHAPDIPYLAVDLGREGAGEEGAEVVARIQAGRWPTGRLTREPVLERRGPAARWHEEAAGLARELAELAHRGGAEVVVLGAEAGEPWERGFLVDLMPAALRERTVTVASGGRPAAAGRALLEEELDEMLSGRLNVRDLMHLDMFRAQLARHPDASQGLDAATAALRRGRAQALLVNRPARPLGQLWRGEDPAQVGRSAEELRAAGATSVRAEPAESALLRAVVGTGAELVVVPRDELPLADGLGVLLRTAAG
ncbi:hypothetical protein GCM10027168_32180 [Streptomyces capparidis]